MSIRLEVITPRGALVDVDADEVSAPGVEGDFTVLPQHRGALILLGGGAIQYRSGGRSEEILVRGGIAEVSAERVLILADAGDRPDEADAQAAAELLSEVASKLSSTTFLDDETLRGLENSRRYAEAVLARRAH